MSIIVEYQMSSEEGDVKFYSFENLSESEKSLIRETNNCYINTDSGDKKECDILNGYLLGNWSGISEEEKIFDAKSIGIEVEELGKYSQYEISKNEFLSLKNLGAEVIKTGVLT